jgi:hypothetical protein
MERIGLIEHHEGVNKWTHANDILTRLECDVCAKAVIRLLQPLLAPYIARSIQQHERYHHDRY